MELNRASVVTAKIKGCRAFVCKVSTFFIFSCLYISFSRECWTLFQFF